MNRLLWFTLGGITAITLNTAFSMMRRENSLPALPDMAGNSIPDSGPEQPDAPNGEEHA